MIYGQTSERSTAGYMLIPFAAMAIFGICVLYDNNAHKKERRAVPRILMSVLGVAALAIALINLLAYMSESGLI